MAVSGIVLAGGRSSRMGRDKTLLQWDNETLIERNVKKLRQFADDIIVASNNTAKYNLPGVLEVPDTYPGMGPLGGMHAALLAARHSYAFVVSCDMPFFTVALAEYLLACRAGYDAVVPEIRSRWEPLCAVYSRACIAPIEKCLLANERTAYVFYPEIRVRKVREKELSIVGDPDELFCNINTPEDLKYLGKCGSQFTTDGGALMKGE